ncbi:alpha-ketoglutarate-dependent dioxygenase AlkB [Winogradskyella sp. PG-2]|uniref:alpha-ketoglutarate-dependent dioxygenase AlkB n=1 Tax=Winogradskyella sp. PG-2 TaxID=754409 RepID=UPI0004586342|nr:alpha-ketoglutarate-dependent dioxygenase AlkB [Winogradskyella sp. PG-2]BAO75737.1 alkylated DNA repair protein [Winogradskyella sp. PG-2]
MEGIIYIENFLSNHRWLFETLLNNIIWDESMINRKTASFGRPYNYSQMEYPFQEFTSEMKEIINSIEEFLEIRPNNCLINYYENGNSRMGYHSDQIDILEENTGVIIISLGETRTLQFRNIEDRENTVGFNLVSGSLIYMNNEVQNLWQHAIIKSDTENGRMSLTFRKLK